jgi:O-antigen ligase
MNPRNVRQNNGSTTVEAPSIPLRKLNPLLYWTTVLYAVGAPNFLHFDDTGRTHGNGLFNLTSISTIAIAFVSAYILLVVVLLSRRHLFCRKVSVAAPLWILLLLQLILSSTLQPASRLTPPSVTDHILSFYRMWEWFLGFALILALYTRTPINRGTELIVELIGRLSWIWITITWIMLPIMPSQVYGEGGEGEIATGHRQLGGQLISPSYLATLSIAGFFYALFFFPRGLKRTLGCVVAFVTIVLARTRFEQASFLLLLFLYAVVFSGKTILRVATIISASVIAALGILFRNIILAYVERGQSANSLTTLNDRTFVWKASLDAIRLRPILGYGFVSGAKNAIRDHWIHANWIPPHAHNEFIQAMLSGGVLALILVLCIYGRALWVAWRTAYLGPRRIILLFLMILFLVRSLGGSNITFIYTRVGALFLLTVIGILADQTGLSRRKHDPVSIDSHHLSHHEVGV